MVNISDLVLPTDSSYFDFANGPGNTIDADLVNGNFTSSQTFITNITKALQDSIPETNVASTYTALQTYTGGIVVDAITSTGTGIDTIYTNNGAGRLKIDGTADSLQVATQLFVAQQIAAGVTSPVVFTGASSSTDGTSGLVPIPLTAQDDDRKFLRGDGDWEFVSPAFTEVTTTATAVPGAEILADTTGGAYTITLPASPEDNIKVSITDHKNSFNVNNLTVAPASGKTIGVGQGNTGNLVLDINNSTVTLKYFSTDDDWVII